MTKRFASKDIIEFLHDSKQTGSWIYNTVQMIIRKIEILEIKDYDGDWIISEFEDELNTIKTIRSSKYLDSTELKGKDNSKKIGLSPSNDEDEYWDKMKIGSRT